MPTRFAVTSSREVLQHFSGGSSAQSALRLLTLIEVQVRQSVKQTGELWIGLYEGQPQRATAKPTAPQLLGAIARARITLTRVDVAGMRHWHLTPLPPLLERTLACLGLSPSLYQRLIENST